MLLSVTLGAGGSVEFNEVGDFFRLMSAPAAVDVAFYQQGRKVAESPGVSGGYAEKFAEHYDKFTLTSATAQTIQFAARLGNSVQYDAPPTGNVTVTNPIAQQGAFTQAPKTVTSASAPHLAALATRRYLLIQNNDAAGIVYVRLDGAVATAANGIKLAPGASLEIFNYTPTGAISAIGDIASNANVIMVEA